MINLEVSYMNLSNTLAAFVRTHVIGCVGTLVSLRVGMHINLIRVACSRRLGLHLWQAAICDSLTIYQGYPNAH